MIVSAAAAQNKNVIIRSDTDADGLVSDDPPFDQLAPPYGGSYQKGVRVAAGDTDNSGFFSEVITAPGGPNQPVKVYDDTADAGVLLSDNPPTASFGATTAATGSFVAFARTVSPSSYGMTTSRSSSPTSPRRRAGSSSRSRPGVIRDLDLNLGISHTFDADLTLSLLHRSPDGSTQIQLWSKAGGGCDGFLIALNDEAGTDIGAVPCPSAGNAISGSFNPEDTSSSRRSTTRMPPGRGRSRSPTTRPATAACCSTGP